jgi:CRP-like cAMP-binding protein
MIFAGNTFMTVNIGNSKLMLEALCLGRTPHSFRLGSRIPLQGDDIYIVTRGIIRIQTLSTDGDESILGFVGPMMPIARRFTLLDPYEVYALTPVDILRLQWEEVQASDELLNELNKATIRRLLYTEVMLSFLSQKHIIERLIRFISFLSKEFGKPTPQGIRLEFKLTHQQIATVLNTTRVTVTRLMGELERASFISLDKKRNLYVLDELSNNELGFSKFF